MPGAKNLDNERKFKTETISIITPSLNQADFIERGIKSVLDQAGEFYIDYIIADGGSDDGSVEIIKKYDELVKNKQYPIRCGGIEFRWWSRPDKSQTDALNRGFKIAKGRILAWINSDDWYAPGAFEFILRKFKENPEVDLIYGNCFEVYDKGKIKQGEAIQGDFKKNLEEGCLISQPAAFFTKRILDKVGYLDESLNYCMDYDLWLRIMRSGKALYIKKDLAYFRIWPGSKTASGLDKFKQEENIIRQKYGGPKINPGNIHRCRQKFKFLDCLKSHYPKIYYSLKKLVYRIVNSNKYKNG